MNKPWCLHPGNKNLSSRAGKLARFDSQWPGYTKAQFAAFGLNLPDKWASPVWASRQWTGAYFNLPGFLIVFILTLLLVRGENVRLSASKLGSAAVTM